ncbi:MAG: hypothetical protein O2931_01520 [Planctomycetota bacterium]|nr:hypothetical protein [Planctomycetota bacterium]MDA1177452.1 hypothetical protein [Planctomycetota bacterium]
MVSLQIPGPQVIRSECQEIRRAWTSLEWKRRAENAVRRQAEFMALLDEIELGERTSSPPVQEPHQFPIVAAATV